MWSGSFRFVLPAVLGFTALAIIVIHEWIASPSQIKDAVSDGVTDFNCPALSVEEPSGSLYGHNHTMRAALWMPQSCVEDLQNRIRSSSLFAAESCNMVETCWIRRNEQRTYSFTFYPDYVGFRFEER
jgi:hypothetical protein